MTLQAKINELNQAYAVAFVAEGSNAMTPEIEQRLLNAQCDVNEAMLRRGAEMHAAGWLSAKEQVKQYGFWKILGIAFDSMFENARHK